MPVVAKTPTWLARLAPGMPTAKSTTVSPLRSWPTGRSPIRSARKAKSSGVGRHHPGELGGQALGLAEHGAGPPGAGRRGQIAEAAALGHPVGAAVLLVQGMGARLAPFVVGQQRPRHPLGPARLAVLGPVGDIDDPEQVAPVGGLVHPDQQLADEEILVGGGPERGLSRHVLPNRRPLRTSGHRACESRSRQPRSIRR